MGMPSIANYVYFLFLCRCVHPTAVTSYHTDYLFNFGLLHAVCVVVVVVVLLGLFVNTAGFVVRVERVAAVD